MRNICALIATVALLGCSAGDAPGESGAQESLRAEAETPDALFVLSGEGIEITGPLGATLAYGSSREAVEAEAARVIGVAQDRAENDECGAGPMQFTSYAGGLTLNFQDGKLVGWYLDGDADIATDKGIAIGDPVSSFTQAHSAEAFDDSTLGEEYFSESDGIGAFAGEGDNSAAISSLFAGTNCFFR